jgi:putative transcriptional regulator
VKKTDLNKKIGQRIIALREKKGWSQSDLARACSKDRQAIEKLENGKVNPTLYSLYEIAKALEIHPKKLLDFEFDFGE